MHGPSWQCYYRDSGNLTMRDLYRGNTLRFYNPYPQFIYLGSVFHDIMPKHMWPNKQRWKSMKSLERKKNCSFRFLFGLCSFILVSLLLLLFAFFYFLSGVFVRENKEISIAAQAGLKNHNLFTLASQVVGLQDVSQLTTPSFCGLFPTYYPVSYLFEYK